VIHTRVEDHLDSSGNVLADPTVATANQHVFLPGIGLQYSINEWLGVLAGVHRGFAPVGPGQLPGVRPEQSISLEGGLRVHHEDAGIDAEAVAFYNSYSNLLLSCGATSGCTGGETGQQFNAGSANIEGVEVLYAHAIDITDDVTLPLRLTYTFTQARLRDVAATVGTPDFLDAKDGDRLPYVPMHQANLEIGLDWNDLGVRIAGTLLGKMLEQAGEANEVLMTDRYVMLDVVANYQVRPRAQLYVRLENITNAQPITSRRPFGARPARPFQAQVGLKIDL
jgi:Fe(3+) dicitrate transport protein